MRRKAQREAEDSESLTGGNIERLKLEAQDIRGLGI